MLLVLTTINKQTQRRKFTCQLSDLEDAFEILNRIVALGDTLTNVYVVDEGKRTNLPPAAFDGSAFLCALRAMENQWQMALCEPRKADLSGDQELIGWTKQREALYQSSINTHQLMIRRLEELVQRAMDRLPPNSDTNLLIEHYRTLIKYYQAKLGKASLGLATVVRRLQQLGA